MKANNSSFSIHATNQVIRDKKYFVYHNKQYPVNFDLLKINSNYFYKNQDQFREEQYIELIDEKEDFVKLSDESINAFISSCQNEQCSINKSSIIQLQYLAHKFEYNELIRITDQIIKDYSEDLIFETLFFKIDEMENKNNNNSFFDTSKEEKFISNNLHNFIQKEEMLKLPIPILYRILTLFYKQQQIKEEIKNDVITFLFNCLDKYGKPASVLFSIIDFEEQKIEVVDRLIENYSDKFDFNLINKTLTKTVKYLTSEITKQKEEYSKMFEQMKETFKQQLEELKEMKKQEEEKQKQNEIENQKRIDIFSSDVNKIKNNVDDKMKSIQDQFKQICTKQEEFIDNAAVKKYHRMILETITFGQFRKFDDKLKEHFKTELVKIEQKNKEELLHAKVILDCISIPESYENIQIILIFKGEVKNHSKIKVTNDIIEDLNQNEQLDSCLTKCVNISNEIVVEIEYPCNKFEQKMKILSDFKTQKYHNMKVSVTINDKSYFEQEEYINNADIIKYQEMFLESITFGQFRRFDDKSKDNFIKGLYKNENEQKNENELLRARLLLNISSIPDSYDYYQIVDFLRKYENNQTKFTLTKDNVDNLYQKGQLDSCLTNCVMAFNDFVVEIEYPFNDFEQIMKIFSDIKAQNEQKMKVSVTINDKSYFEQKNKWNKIINICKVAKSINVIPEKSFYEFSNLSVLELSIDTIAIEASSFQNCSSLTQIKIPEKVTKIGDCSFQNCSSLKEIAIPASVKSIGENCFDGCSKLDRLTINPFYTQIQFNKFNKSPSLEHYTISTTRDSKLKTNAQIFISYNITEILYQTNFLNSSELTSYISECSEIIFEIQYPSSNFSNIYQKVVSLKQNNSSKIKIGIFYTQLKTTDKYFYNNKDINYVRFDSNVKRTPNDANDSSDGSFQNCSSLIELFIPSSLDKIGNRTFCSCTSLKKINFEHPSSVTSIGNNAFNSCTSLTQIEIPSSVTSIGNYALSHCKSLTRITIPSSVTVIEHDTFYDCTSLTQVLIPPSVTSIGECAFQSCTSLVKIEIPSSVKIIDNYAFYNCTSLTQVLIPPSVTSIGENAFKSCTSLVKIEIPSSVTSIGSSAFSSCTSLTQITIPSRINTNNLSINSNATIYRI
ncbi:hypothetical protein M9Y10_031110 [Tritrichomonas musculus]|uniref:Uncharacterized protein n=1 Tax=Tritrichomonas musculus TaxID=1915356 RepID=A0ABR2H3Y3_9EUKA